MNLIQKSQTLSFMALMLIIGLTQYSCGDNVEDLNSDHKPFKPTEVIDVNSDLSKIDFENFVLNHPNFIIKVNDTLSFIFKDIIIPERQDPESDIIYFTSDERGHISFREDKAMYFIYNEDYGVVKDHDDRHSLNYETAFSVKGALYNNPEKALEVRTNEALKIPTDFPTKAIQVLQSSPGHAVIVLTNNRELKNLNPDK